GACSLPTVARALGMGVRTLQRGLHHHHTSFNVLLEDVRRRRTIELLERSLLSVKDVAQAVGYKDARILHRSFRSWTGVSPGEYRRSSE
ncbi:MAG TPA: helix-turn-helix transcriptional regulator, partial [Polyangia bacterium]|nr:helix-turn-helix transcriptional regulator [Polyangia bacterium]